MYQKNHISFIGLSKDKENYIYIANDENMIHQVKHDHKYFVTNTV